FAESISLLMQEHEPSAGPQLSPKLKEQLEQVRERIAETGTDLSSSIIESRYEWIRSVMAKTDPKGPTHENEPPGATAKVDRIVMHPVFGYMLFLFVMALIFQAIFTWAKYPMDWIKTAMDWAGGLLVNHMPAGDLRDLIKDGVLGGVGTTITFLPQILLLFFFISLLEDTGYMSRAAFLMDKLMSKVGLHGRSFIPLLSSFACAIPGIMATRTISNRKARLITILIAPLMSCSARIPVYALMIGAFIPAKAVISIGGHGIVHLPGLVLLSMYVLGMVFAFLFALLFHRTLLKGDAPIFLMELPPYRLPSLKTACLQMIERAWQFVYRAGTMILAISVVLWALTTYPKHPELPEGQRKQYSFVGNAGRFIEPVLKPMGFDWKMGIGIIASFAAREVFVSAMGTVYNVDATDDKGKVDLQSRMRADVDPTTGKPVYTPLVAICVMIYYVLAMQCMSTVVVVRRETGTWSWPLFQIAYMTGLAWVVTTVVYQVGRFAGWG
ncbi:MAG: ferrous iron transport protein B, partial [Chthonomonadales bacterium]